MGETASKRYIKRWKDYLINILIGHCFQQYPINIRRIAEEGEAREKYAFKQSVGELKGMSIG